MDAAELDLPGKPDPAVFLEAARRLGVDPAQAAVIEDAVPGVEAGRQGGFALVVGVDRVHRPGALDAAGADVVVSDLAELAVSVWLLVFDGFDHERVGLREALCTLGNGYLATRGATRRPARTAFTIQGRTSPGSSTAWRRTSPDARSRTRASSTSRTGSR